MPVLTQQHPLALSLCLPQVFFEPKNNLKIWMKLRKKVVSHTEIMLYIKWAVLQCLIQSLLGPHSILYISPRFFPLFPFYSSHFYVAVMISYYWNQNKINKKKVVPPSISDTKHYSVQISDGLMSHSSVMCEKVFYLLLNVHIQCCVLYQRRRDNSSDIVGTTQLDAGQLDSCHWTAARVDSPSDLHWLICLHYVVPCEIQANWKRIASTEILGPYRVIRGSYVE